MDTFHGNSNSLPDVRLDLAKYSLLANNHKCLFLLIHHITKSGSASDPHKNTLNGSQAIEAKIRVVLDLRKQEDCYHFTITKGNYCSNKEKERSLKLNFNDESRSFESTATYHEFSVSAGKAKYTDSEIVKEIVRLRKENISFEKIREQLLYKFDKNKVPGLTTIKSIANKND